MISLSLLTKGSCRYALSDGRAVHDGTGEGGIRTLGSLLGYGALAKRCFQPLSHLTKIVATALWAVTGRATGAWLQSQAQNIPENCRLPTPTCVVCSRFYRSCQLPIAN